MDLRNILSETNFEFKKKFGQNFISDENLLKAICADAKLTKEDEVLEIGVGAGTLTKIIAQNAKKVVGYEIDKTLASVHEKSLANVHNATVVFGDFLKAEPSEINSHFDVNFKVVANLPYYVTTDIIFKLIEENINAKSLTLMVQKEVAERLVSKPKTKEYGTITVELDAISNVRIARIVDRRMFNPMPNVDSAIVTIELNRTKYQIADFHFLQKVIRAGFSMRRKTLSNCLKSSLGLSTEKISQIYSMLGLKDGVRGEELTTEQYVKLANCIFENK
jgi:16S rRNA (adenine1518-N6/adenine1519-N6)-dimethyltransferase